MHVTLSSASRACRQPLSLGQVHLLDGFWRDRQIVNRAVSLRHGYHMLEQAGNFNNLRLVIGKGEGPYRGYVFQDSDIYKWLEAVACELANGPDTDLQTMADEVIALIAAAQMPDGYLNSSYQLHKPAERWTNLDHDHEMYCAGHLIEAGIAHRRATGRTDLFDAARRFADHIDSIFGPGRRSGACGHPEIELALVELYRETGERRYLDLASFFIDQRGHRTMRGYGSLGPEYHQDRVPIREATVVEGHAVRQLYLNSGVTDVYLETGEAALLDAMNRLWRDMTAHKMYLTGGVGSRGFGEAFGDAYELPSRDAYCETCAAIAAMMWNWRMLLATGEPRFADALERTLYNGFLSGVSLDGRRFFYENPLQSDGGVERAEWHRCACCPPNVMRQMARVGDYLATTDPTGIQIHQYASARIETDRAVLIADTGYPWDGRVQVAVDETPGSSWRLSLRIPHWCEGASLRVNDQPMEGASIGGTYAAVERAWQTGDIVDLRLPMPPRLTAPHPRVDAIRGCLAIERGPLVYCLEGVDQEPGVSLSDARIDPASALRIAQRDDRLGGVVTIEARGAVVEASAWADRLYRPAGAARLPRRETKWIAVPYYAWANRGAGQMRIWLPES